jgi:hypothetical protein
LVIKNVFGVFIVELFHSLQKTHQTNNNSETKALIKGAAQFLAPSPPPRVVKCFVANLQRRHSSVTPKENHRMGLNQGYVFLQMRT